MPKGRRRRLKKTKQKTAIEKELEMTDALLKIRERANELLKHDPKTPDYLTDVVRLHCANPAFGACCSAILTMIRCHGRPQKALESRIGGIMADVDKDKRTEFRSLITQLHGRLPPRQKPEAKVKVPDETSADFNKLLDKLASANMVEDIDTEALF